MKLTKLFRRSDSPEGSKGRAGLAAVVAGCVALTSVVVLTGAGDPNSGFKFTQSGHWIYNSAIGRVFHLDSATLKVDAQVPLTTGTPGAQVVQTDTDAYVLSKSRIDKFGKSDLSVAEPLDAPTGQAVGLEAAGSAFAIYQEEGRVMRLGKQPATAFLGVPLGDPVVTSDGTLWVHRVEDGGLCQLPLTVDRMSCPATVQKGHKGALTVIGNKAVFVDLTADRVTDLTPDGFGSHVDLSNDVPESAVVAANDVDGRIAFLDRDQSAVLLIGLPDKPGQKADAPIVTKLQKGNYDKVASSGHGLAVLGRKSSDLATVDRDGHVGYRKIESHNEDDKVKHEPNLFRGDDSKVYVESGKGDQVVVVDEDGKAEPVKIATDDDGITHKPTKPPTPPKPKQPDNKPDVPVHTQEPPEKKDPPPAKVDPRDRDRPDVPEKKDPPPKMDPPPKKDPPKKPTVQAGVPGAPSGVSAKHGTDGPTVSWRAATANGAPITAYVLSWSGGSKTVSGSTRSTLITELAGRTTAYTVTIRARNRVGLGPAVRTGQIKRQYAEAESPREIVVSKDGTSGQLTLAWDRPTMGDGVFVRYTVSIGSATAKPRVNTTTTEATVTGLKDGTKYLFYVRAITRAPNGDLLSGKWTSLTGSPLGKDERTKRVVASRGAGTEYDDCQPPECAFIQVRIENLRPNTRYTIVPYVDNKKFNPGATLTTDGEGHMLVDDRFPCGMVGKQVYVLVSRSGETYKSNTFTWKSG
ncbi:fibronectin type III domain-containing protein [Kribbella sp. NPDC056345]|uniref:fibronectin type III domain-containing protein n=1 Tax=Kribbella sp. NPDC056345 TaxID=3345789 RepID=UPI0035D7DC60